MKKISGKNLQEAITNASIELGCSVTKLDYEIIQYPSGGFLGIGKKEAIIVASIQKEESLLPQEMDKKTEDKKSNIQEDCIKIQSELKELLSLMPYEIDTIKVEPYGRQVVSIFLDGKDTALLIGEKGYRYQALSYLLFNWIHLQYGYGVRLEIAQFLKMQEEIVEQYLKSIADQISNHQSFKTKNLSGILGVIALKRLRELYPGRYICLKQEEQEQYISISNP